MSFRKFYIENGDGNEYFLANQDSKVFLNNPGGLGFSNSIETVQYADRLVAEPSQNFPSISGEILFYDTSNADRYQKYNNFVTFLMSKPLIFYYEIPTVTPMTFLIEVEVSSLDKTESKNDGVLRCNFTLQGLSRWKGEGVYSQGASDTHVLVNEGHMPCGFEITIEGDLTNPYFTLEQDGEIYGEAKFDDSTAFNSVYVDSNDGQQEVILEQGGSVLPNPLSYQDLSISNGAIYVTFMKLARGESTLRIGMDSGTIDNVSIMFVPLYRSV